MSQVWERPDLDPYERLILLALADHADDDGVCYPSISRLVDRTGMAERGVQKVLKRLAEKGHLSVETNAGRNGTNRYSIALTPAPGAPRTRGTTAQSAPAPEAPPPHLSAKTPAPGAPEPSRTLGGGGGSACARETDQKDELEAILEAAGIDWRKDVTGKWFGTNPRWTVERWRALGLSQAEIMAVLTESRPRNGPPGSLAYFDQAMQRAAGRKKAAPLSPIIPTGAPLQADPAAKRRASWRKLATGLPDPGAAA